MFHLHSEMGHVCLFLLRIHHKTFQSATFLANVEIPDQTWAMILRGGIDIQFVVVLILTIDILNWRSWNI